MRLRMTAEAEPRYTFILVHGAWQGAWAWDTIVPRLEAAGHVAIAADLPGDGHDDTPAGAVTLDSYVSAVTALVDGTSGPVVLIGHSMGGVTVSQVCELRPDRVALAIYLCAFMLPDGMAVLDFYERHLEPWMRGAHSRLTYANDASTIDPVSAVEVFYQMAEPALAAAAAARLTPQPDGPRQGKLALTEERYGAIPRIYVEALQDRSVHLPLQRKMQELAGCAAVYGLESDHAPQLSMPDPLTEVLLSVTAAHARPLGPA